MSSSTETAIGRTYREGRAPAAKSSYANGSSDGRDTAPNGPANGVFASEQQVIGALLIGADWGRIADLVHREDYAEMHRLILTAIESLAADGRSHDVTMVQQLLERVGHLQMVGGLAYLSELARNTATAANVRDHACAVRKAAIRCRLPDGFRDEDAIATLQGLLGELNALEAPARASALQLESAAEWAHRPEPAPRDWVVEGLIPGARVTSFLGNGGLGKTIIAGQIGVHVATGRPLFGLSVCGGPVLGIFCEDERDELERRIRAASAGEQLDLAALERLYPCSRDGMDNLLCTFDRDKIVLTPFYRELEATVAQVRPRLLILDTAADLFAGDYVSTPHVRQFIKVALGRLCIQHGCAVLLLAHPSAAALSSGDGGGFSTAWNNSVRSRLYLRRPKSDDPESVKDRRILEVKKANYAADGLTIPLLYQGGYFVPDPDPLKESAKAARAPRVSTRLASATLQVLRDKGRSGAVVSFGDVFEPLKAAGELPEGGYEVVRKPLQRTLEQLKAEGLITFSKVPRGYRVVSELQ